MTLRDLLEEKSTELPGTQAAIGPDGSITWSRGGRPFAVAAGDGSFAEFALDPAVADAAARTPDVTPSDRGKGWVTFAPIDLDDHAADRAVAWLASAHRRLEPQN
jgi:hypothetical protein